MLTLPNFLTLLRIIAIPVFLIALANGNHSAAFILFLAAGVTDAVDGAVARLTDSHSSLGAVLDPLADKLLLLSAFIVLGFTGALPAWLAALVVARDVIIVLGYGAVFVVDHEWMDVAPTMLGKLSTFFQLFTIGFVLLRLARPELPLATATAVLQIATGVLTAGSGIQYVYRGLLWHQRRVNVGASS
ncbi:MAG: CDP-alcohol phosphatidyltransferase family protein [Candidatus Binatia bacterium]